MDLKDKDNELWKMTNEKEQYRGKAEAGDTTVKSQQVRSVCMSSTHVFGSMCMAAWALAPICLPVYCACILVCQLFCVFGFMFT